jgi:hypothetical protein
MTLGLRTCLSFSFAFLFAVPALAYGQVEGPLDEPSGEHAAPALTEAYVSFKATLAFAGSLGASTPSYVDQSQPVAAFEATGPLGSAFGAAVQYTFAPHRYFGLGGQLGVQSWRSDVAASGGQGRSVMVDLAVVPQGRVPLGRRFELYLAVPLGLSLSVLSEAESWIAQHPSPRLGPVEDIDPRYGWTIAALLGARIAISRSFGALLEVGYIRHQVTHSVDVRFISETAQGAAMQEQAGIGLDLGVVTEQLSCNLGIFF